MKIIEKEKLTSDEFKIIKNGLRKSRQLTSQTLDNIQYYAKKWLFFYDSKDNNDILGHAAIKKSAREDFDIEIGFIYTYPDKQYSQEEIIYNLIKYINEKYSNKGIYAEVLLNPIKRIFKKIGYSKIDEWDSKVREGNKVELYTNKNLMIISEDNMSNLWNYLEGKLKDINEETVDLALTNNVGDEIEDENLETEKPLKIGVFRNNSKKGIEYVSLPLKQVAVATDIDETDFRVTTEGMDKILISLLSKGLITKEAKENFINNYKDKSLQVSSDTIELNVKGNNISIAQLTK